MLLSRAAAKTATRVSSRAGRPAGFKSSTALCATPEDAVQAHIDSNKVAIFSKTYCPYCSRAKSLFADTLKIQAGVVELDAMGAEGAAIQQALQARTGMRTVPQVFVSGKLVGGCDDTVAAHQSGELKKLLAAAGISI